MKYYFKNSKEIYKKIILVIKNDKKPLIVSGGNTIKKIFKNLNTKINNKILLSDERLVKKNSNLRNDFFFKKMINKNLLLKKNFIHYDCSYYDTKCLRKINKTIGKIKFSSAILSLGSNGHFASLFGLDKNKLDYQFVNNSPKFPKKRVSISFKKLKKCKKIYFVASKNTKKKEIKNFYKNKLIKTLGFEKTELLIY